jgi:hypothetical protein
MQADVAAHAILTRDAKLDLTLRGFRTAIHTLMPIFAGPQTRNIPAISAQYRCWNTLCRPKAA